MSEGSSELLREVRALREEVLQLTLRVIDLEGASGQAPVRPGRAATSSPITVTCNFPPGPPVYSPAPSSNQAGASSTAGSAANGPACSGQTRAADYTEAERREVAAEVGRFFRRCLAGEERGTSGRDRIRLQSRYYVLCRDISGQCYNPVRVFSSFTALKPLVKQSGSSGDSVFAGFPTYWEASVAVAAAGLQWPPPDAF